MQGIEFAADRILLGSCREQHLVQVCLERGVPIFAALAPRRACSARSGTA